MEIVVGLIAGVAVVGLAAWLVQEFRWRQKNAELKGQLQSQQAASDLIQAAKVELNTAFQASAGQALHANSEQFLKLAEQNFGKSQKEFENLVKPLSENYAKLNPSIESLMQQNISITAATQGLRDALSDSRQVGLWGEIQLRRIIELAGMTQYADFAEQQSLDGSGGRPDVMIKLPEGRAIVIDSKASTAAYLEAQEAETENDAQQALLKHAGALRTKVDDLVKRNYGQNVEGSLDFTVMFVPGDQFLAAALRARNDLIEYAMSKRVAIATPSTLIALLWAVANGWDRHGFAQDVEAIRQAGAEMHNRLQAFMGHYRRVGEQLGRAAQSFNASVGSFDRNVMPQARRFEELPGVSANPDALPAPVDVEVRESTYSIAGGYQETAAAKENPQESD